MATKKYDVVVIGAGQAGIPLAQALAKAGRKVALAERKHLGGSCVNYGCTPTKAAIASARVAHMARRATEFGVDVGSVKVDFPRVLARAREIVASSRASLGKMVASTEGLDLLEGDARFTGRAGKGFALAIDGVDVEAAQVVLNTGTRTSMPPIDGLDAIACITSETWLDRDELPRELLMVGGGYIGLEMGQFYRRMGCEVTIVNSGSHVAGHEDADVSDALQEALEREGIRFMMDAKVVKVESRDSRIIATVESGNGSERIEGSHLFVATGRKPNTDTLGLESVGLAPEENGTLKPGPGLSTEVEGIWVAGDIRGGPMFTHTAWDDYRILESQMLGDGARTLERVVPYAVFTDPELGRVGMTETEARKDGRKIQVGRFEMRHDGKAREIGETAGFIKVIADAANGQLLGASVLAYEGAELVHAYVQLMNAKAPCSVMENAVHIHPTLSEAVQSAVAAIGAARVAGPRPLDLACARCVGDRKGLDLHQQVAAADVGDKACHLHALPQRRRNLGSQDRHISRVAHICLELGLPQAERTEARGFGEHRPEVRERLTRLCRDVAAMHRLVANDARRSRNEEQSRGLEGIRHRACEDRALQAILAWVLPGMDLARVLDLASRRARGHEVHRKLLAGERAQPARCRDGFLAHAVRRFERVVPPDVEQPITLGTVLHLVDAGNVVPEAQHVRISRALQQGKDFLVQRAGTGLERTLRFRRRQRAEHKVCRGGVADAPETGVYRGFARGPHFAQRIRVVDAGDPDARARHRVVGGQLNAGKSHHAEEAGRPVLEALRGSLQGKVFELQHGWRFERRPRITRRGARRRGAQLFSR